MNQHVVPMWWLRFSDCSAWVFSVHGALQVFVGRTAQLGFLAAVIGEKVTGKGILQQVGIETGVEVSATA